MEESKKKPKTRQLRGIVTSNKMDKSAVLTQVHLVKHPLVGKYVRRSTKFMFHDPDNICQLGDEVLISPSRPWSARKNFSLMRIVKRAKE